MRRLLAFMVAFVLVVAACGNDADPTESTQASSTSEETATPPESSSSSIGSETGSTSESPTESIFAITKIDFENDMVEITNIGSGSGTLNGFSICQRPNYFAIGDVELASGESTTIAASQVDGFDPSTGELGLYASGQFSSPDDIVSYVEWGESGHGRSATAVAGNVWNDGGFVATDDATLVITAIDPPALGPDGWTIG